MKPSRWARFPEFYYTDYFYMNTRYWDAVVFIPKRNIVFFGWGLFANFNGTDMDLKVQWQIGEQGEKSDEYELKMSDSDKEPEKKWFTIDIREFGVKPIKVNEGERIHVKCKVGNDEQRRCFYGYSGNKEKYSVIPN